jgi:N-hydroxyarylamine O-acetyltransferase
MKTGVWDEGARELMTMRYLSRLGITFRPKPGLEALKELHLAHLINIPFENLDIGRGVEIRLDQERILNKIVDARRGGFCYELNGAFAWLLRRLGYKVSLLSARVFDSDSQKYGPEFDHLVLLVHLDNLYLVDVGFGDSFREPLMLPSGRVEDVSGVYRVGVSEENGGETILQSDQGEGWRSTFCFSLQARDLDEFREMCNHNQVSQRSHFTRQSVCSIATEVGRISLTPEILTITNAREKQTSSVNSPQAYRELLAQHFGVVLDGD